ncbi:MAG: sigma-54 dependent transcriptional regulator [Alphaproteobacteria bacterium]|nr:sigma-54 dependent transcriptional regulator [Alphaproteobacteria bacterium]MBU6471176.1 sigma-54 dependent transcriptional regulator [Alphaproteobacteria bacterium]MDE2014527.1 sigma-54-dependent Fis family transcriptional regulator [Alphaproteobacteria bacterium]MDE2074856.1 sigma-54-dependent Fis family transcriptional regulator [Alphaproteobacteria bacterium]MDE2352776.1 sigma-54-dependent Fis family transcriptional regulator [Alphaproteobacteria bacterium]
MEPSIAVAFIDDDAALRNANVQTLELTGFRAQPFESAEAALAVIDRDFEGVIVTDVRMPRIDGLQLFQRIKAIDPDLPVILISGHGDIDMAVSAMHDGAYDFLTKPFAAERLVESVRRAAEKRGLVMANRRLRQLAQQSGDGGSLIGQAPSILRLRETLRHIAEADVDVLVVGETGSGKEVAAQLLHDWSKRKDKRFVALNCGALPETVIESELFGHEPGAFTGAQSRRIGLIEHASGGTLFLDEIESMPLATQVKLLRVLEQRTITPLGSNTPRSVDLRVVAAAKVDLGAPSQRERFREDLFYRLNVVTLRIPPLRERREDVPLLFAHFLAQATARFGRPMPPLTDTLRAHLNTHDWPGNVRELSHFAERIALGVGDLELLQSDPQSQDLALPQRMERYEAQLIREALAFCKGDVQATIETLGIPRKTFYDKLNRHGIDRTSFVPASQRATKPDAGEQIPRRQPPC